MPENQKKIQGNNNWKRNIITIFSIVGFVSLFWFISVFSVRYQSTTSDETWHVVAGLTPLRYGDFRMSTDNPYFPNAIAALPLALNKSFKLPSVKDDLYRYANISEFTEKTAEINGGVTERGKYRLTADQIFRPRVAMISMISILLLFYGLFIYKVFGTKISLIALVLLAFSPSFLGHARLTTTDVIVAMTIFLASFLLWRLYKARSLNWSLILFLSFVVMSFLALMSKNTTLLVAPFWLFLLGFILVRKTFRKGIFLRSLGIVGAIAIPLLIVLIWFFSIHVAYGSKSRTLRKTRYKEFITIQEDKNRLLAIKGGEKLVEIYDKKKLPMTFYLQGVIFNMIFKNVQGHESFFLGKFKNVGPWYYMVAFLTKETIPFVIASLFFLGWLLALFIKGKLRRSEILFLGIPPLVIALIFSFSKVKIGIRHILLVYPFLTLGVAIMIGHFLKNTNKIKRTLVYAAGVFIFVSIAAAYPDYISYFNMFIGGSHNGYKWIQDSNFDWGQNELLAQKIVENSRGNISYKGDSMPQPGKYYLIRLTDLYGSVRNRTEQTEAFRKLLEDEKLKIVKYSLPTHWIVYYPEKAK